MIKPTEFMHHVIPVSYYRGDYVMEASIDAITVDPSRRRLDPAKVAELKRSIERVGLINPITVTLDGRLVAGRHRLQAIIEIGLSRSIPVTFLDKQGLDVELAEIDENLIRNNGTELDQSVWMARRKEIYEVLYPATKHGGAPGKAGGGKTAKDATVASFAVETAKKTGKSKRAIANKTKIGKALKDVAARLADTPVADSQKDLLALAKMPLDEREEAVKQIALGAASSVAQVNFKRRETAKAAQVRALPDPPLVVQSDAMTWIAQQEPADLLITDPPYRTDVKDIVSFARDWLPKALSKVKPTGRAYVCIGAYPDEIAAYLSAGRAGMTLANVLVWTYRNTLGPKPTLDYKLNWQAILYFRGPDAPPLDCPEMNEQFSVQDINAPDGRQGDHYHAWQKPDELAERLIRHSTQPGQTVIDCFVGTGTFLLAAARLGRLANGCEVMPNMLAIAEERGCLCRYT